MWFPDTFSKMLIEDSSEIIIITCVCYPSPSNHRDMWNRCGALGERNPELEPKTQIFH